MAAADQPGWPKFVEVLGSVFQQWTALHLAVDQQWGGLGSQQKGEKMMADTLTFFLQSTPQDPVYPDELSDFFEDTMVEAFSCDAEDGSCREVAEVIVKQFTACVVNGDITTAEQLIAQAPGAAQRALQASQAGAAPEPVAAVGGAAAAPITPREPIVDADGFELVVGRNNDGQPDAAAATHAAAQTPQAQADMQAAQEAQEARMAQLAARQQAALVLQQQQAALQQQALYADQQRQAAHEQAMYQQQQQAVGQAAAEAQAIAERRAQPGSLDEI